MHINDPRESKHHPNHCTSREEDSAHHGSNTTVALEIGKDFRLPDSSVMFVSADSNDFTENSSETSSPLGSDSQSQLHPSDEENGFILLRRREKNRKAAQKCREKKKERIRVLENTVKDLNNELRILKCRNDKLEKEKIDLTHVFTAHKRYCPLKVEDECTNVYLVEEEHFNHSPDQVPRTSHQIYREQPNIPTPFNNYLYQTEKFTAH